MEEPGSSSISEDEEDQINVRYRFGSVVVAKLAKFPWWPAMVDPSPETGDVYWLDGFEDLTKKNASHYHVVFFDVPGKVTRSWVHATKITPYRQYFPDPLTEMERKVVDSCKNHTNKRRLIEARSIAEAALRMPIEERTKKYSFLHTFKGKITLFDDDGNEKVMDGGRVQDAVTVENIKIRKKPGPKPKTRPQPETVTTEKVEPIKIRKKPGPKPKNKTESSPSRGTSEAGLKRRYSRASSAPTIPPGPKMRYSRASSTSTIPPDTDAPTSAKRPRRSQSSPQTAPVSPLTSKPASDTNAPTSAKRPRRSRSSPVTAPVSPLSSKPASDTDAPTTTKRSRRSRGSPQTAPVSPLSSKPSSDMPKRKKKMGAKTHSRPGRKRGRKITKNTSDPEIYSADSSVTSTPVFSDTFAYICPNTIQSMHESLQATVLAVGDPSQCIPSTSNEPSRCLPSHVPLQEPANKIDEKEAESKLLELKTPTNFGHFEPSENSLENQMTSFLNRIQTQTPKLKFNGKTISNLNLLVAKTEEGDVIDLTGDDEMACQLRYGELVYANLKGLQPWPAVIVMDPEINLCFIPENGAPNYVHVFFFLLKRRAWVPIENVKMFEDTKYPDLTEMLNYENYCKALALAKQASSFSREQRTLQFSNMRSVPMTGGPIVPSRGPDDTIIVL